MYSLNVNALLRYFIKRSTLITFRFLINAPLTWDGWTKMLCKFLIASMYLRNTCLCLLAPRYCLFVYLHVALHYYFMNYLIHAAPVFTSLCLWCFNPTVTKIATIAVFTILLLLLYYYCYYITVATDKPCQASFLPGVLI